MTVRDPFDAADPFDASADMFRRQIAEMATTALEFPGYRALGGIDQVRCLMAGIMTGLIGVCFAHIEPAGRDEMMKAIKRYLPQARENAEGIMRDGASRNSAEGK